MRTSLNVEKNFGLNVEVFLEISDYQDFDPTNKMNGSLPQNSFTTVRFEIEFLMEEFELVVAEEYKFENRAKRLKNRFSNSSRKHLIETLKEDIK